MKPECEGLQALLSGYLDGELDASDRARIDRHVSTCDSCKEEFVRMRELVSAASGIGIAPPPDEVWDTFLANVYNRIELRVGWFLFVVGVAALVLMGVYRFLADPGESFVQKLFTAGALAGLLVLFASVLRQRMITAKTDRYSKEVKR